VRQEERRLEGGLKKSQRPPCKTEDLEFTDHSLDAEAQVQKLIQGIDSILSDVGDGPLVAKFLR
jgi:hypothetical protein